MCEIKYDENPTPAGHQTRTIPLKTATNGQQLNELRSIFVRVPSEHCQLAARIDGIDRGFLFGNAAAELHRKTRGGVVPSLQRDATAATFSNSRDTVYRDKPPITKL